MTDAEVLALKPGDGVKLYWFVDYRGQRLGSSTVITIDQVITRRRSDAERAVGHVWMVVTSKGSPKTWTIESDEYLASMGYQTHETLGGGWGGFGGGVVARTGARKLGAEKL